MSQDEFRGRWQAIQDDFEAQLEQLDSESPVEHLEITPQMVAEHFGTAQPKTETAPGETVIIEGQDGRRWTIPKANLQKALGRGAKQVQ